MKKRGKRAIVRLEETSEWLNIDKGKKSKQMEVMWEQLQVLDNHSKRNNVRLIGLKETLDTNGTPLDCVQRILSEGLQFLLTPSLRLKEPTALAPMPDANRPETQVERKEPEFYYRNRGRETYQGQ